MPFPEYDSFPRYLAAKKSVDDRALNPHVWGALSRAVGRQATVRLLEIGAGIGTMVERLVDGGVLHRAAYTAIDASAENILHARQRLSAWGRERSFAVAETRAGLTLHRRSDRLTLELEAIDLFDFIHRERGKSTWDVLVAHAFLDLVDLPSTLPQLFSLLPDAGLFYFTLNFDGISAMLPQLDPQLDEHIFRLYHRTMDERMVYGAPSGDSCTGRHLLAHLLQAGVRILEAGASDWVVYPTSGSYPGDEAYFLHFIINTVHSALAGHPELDSERLSAWTARRHAQVERGELIYIAHQLDVCGFAKPAHHSVAPFI
jgi:SAM-dependent methyltransferase